MARREVRREAVPVVESPAVSCPEPVQVPAPLVEGGNMISAKAPSVVIIRILKGVCIFQDRCKTRRIPIDSTKPVKIQITQ